jgi:uncharacterized protein YpmS
MLYGGCNHYDAILNKASMDYNNNNNNSSDNNNNNSSDNNNNNIKTKTKRCCCWFCIFALVVVVVIVVTCVVLFFNRGSLKKLLDSKTQTPQIPTNTYQLNELIAPMYYEKTNNPNNNQKEYIKKNIYSIFKNNQQQH